MAIPGFHAIIPAGGAGTRLWPLSRRTAPKFLHDLTGTGRTLIQGTWDRLAPLAGPDGVFIVTGTAHAAAVKAQLSELREANLVAEPSPRDSMPAFGLAAAIIAQREPDAVVSSFAADHVIADIAAFHAAITEAVAAARAGYIVTIGIEPDVPTTALGYIHVGGELGAEGTTTAKHVAAFVEKPDAETAAKYVKSGEYVWNAGMFIVKASVLLAHLAAYRPALADGIMEIARAWDTSQRDDVLARVWPTLEKVPIDYAVAEPAAADGDVAVVPAAFDWDDVGDWRSLGDLLPEVDAGTNGGAGAVAVAGQAAAGVRLLGVQAADVVAIDSPDALVVASDGVGGAAGQAGATTRTPLVTVLGIPGAVVVRTPDAILVTTRENAQQVKAVVDTLRMCGREDLL